MASESRDDHPTGTLRVPSTAPAPAPGSSSRWAVDVSGGSDVGKVRANNEDHFLVARMDRIWRTIGSNLPPDVVPAISTETVYGLLVADGMGGRAAGEVASRMAISTLVELFLE